MCPNATVSCNRLNLTFGHGWQGSRCRLSIRVRSGLHAFRRLLVRPPMAVPCRLLRVPVQDDAEATIPMLLPIRDRKMKTRKDLTGL